MNSLRQDLVYAFRQLRKNLAFTCTAILCRVCPQSPAGRRRGAQRRSIPQSLYEQNKPQQLKHTQPFVGTVLLRSRRHRDAHLRIATIPHAVAVDAGA
jgi:hypothetical protein